MKLKITTLLICFSLSSFCQTGKLKIDITITDPEKPYLLDIYAHKEKDLASKITVIKSGSHLIKNLTEGNYILNSIPSNLKHEDCTLKV